VRAYLGHDRLDSVDQTLALNHLYDMMWLYYNFFQPVMRLTEKILIREEGQVTRVRRRYGPARTPFDRLCDSKAITQEHRELLESLRARTNPRKLRTEIYDRIDEIFSLPNAADGASQNVHLTLASWSEASSLPSTGPMSFQRSHTLRKGADSFGKVFI